MLTFIMKASEINFTTMNIKPKIVFILP
jgi:hypothetical protein